MGSCGGCIRLSLYTVVALIAVLVYFHLECVKKKTENLKNKTNQDFIPEETDCFATLGFIKKGKDIEMKIGMFNLLVESGPCAVNMLASYLGYISPYSLTDSEEHNVTILDARSHSPGEFHETGFTLITLDREPVTTDWRTSFYSNDSPDILHFHEQMEPYIRELYPNTKKILWTFNVVRGGDLFGDQPRAVGGPHLDFHQDDQARQEFHLDFPVLDLPRSEMKLMLEETNGEEHKLGAILGVWKPLAPEKVCDYPLAVMDARTFHPDNLAKNRFHLTFMPGVTLHNLNGAVSHDKGQRWYYYSFQNTREVLVFHHYSKGRWFNNPHTSFLNKNCPKQSGERISVEMRVGLYF